MEWKITEPTEDHVFTGHKMHVKVGDFGTTTPIIISSQSQENAQEVFRLYYQMLSDTRDESVVLHPDLDVLVKTEDVVFFEGCLDNALIWAKPADEE